MSQTLQRSIFNERNKKKEKKNHGQTGTIGVFRGRFIRALQCNTYAHARTVRPFFLLLPPPVIIKEWLLHLMRVVIHYLIIKFPSRGTWDITETKLQSICA